jgi:hypothetical protein
MVIRGIYNFQPRTQEIAVLIQKAVSRIYMYKVVETRTATYQQIGAPHDNGVLPAKIILEHLTIKGFYSRAYADKPKR